MGCQWRGGGPERGEISSHHGSITELATGRKGPNWPRPPGGDRVDLTVVAGLRAQHR